MKKCFLVFLVLYSVSSCKPILNSNIDADLAAVNIALQDDYEITKVSKGFKNTTKTRTYVLHLSDKDAKRIINDIASCKCFDSTYNQTSNENINQNKAYQIKKGYKIYMPDKGGAYRTVYIDTTSLELHISYNGMLI